MEVKELLDNQSIYIDYHNQGDGQPVNHDYIHLHKKMHGKRYKKWEIEIYLNENNVRVAYSKDFDDNSKETKNVKNEIEKAFKNEDKTKDLIKDLTKAIKHYHSKLSNKEKQKKLEDWASKIAKGFGLKPRIKDKIQNETQRYLTVITSHEDNDGKVYFLKQETDPTRIPITASDNLNELYNCSKKYKQ